MSFAARGGASFTECVANYVSRRRPRRPRRPRRRGMVLLIVVVIVMLLSLAAYKYLLAMQTEHMAAAINGDRIQAQQSANSARDLFAMLLEMPKSQRDEMGGLENNPIYFAGDTTALMAGTDTQAANASLSQGKSVPFGLVAYSLRDPETINGQPSFAAGGSSNGLQTNGSTSASTSSNSSDYAAGNSSFYNSDPTASLKPPTRYGAINESSKLHLARLLQIEEESSGAGVDALMSLPQMDRATAESLLDWIDEDDDARASGAESDFYSRLSRPMVPRNSLPPDLDELLFVKGVTAWNLYGTQNNLPAGATGAAGIGAMGQGLAGNAGSYGATGIGTSSASNSYAQSATSPSMSVNEPFRPWIQFLTVYGAERNETYTGKPRLFLNDKELQELHSGLTEALSKEWADFIILYRQFGPADEESKENETQETQETEQSGEEQITIQFETSAEVLIQSPLDLLGVSVAVPIGDDEGEDGEQKEKKTILVPSPAGSDTDSYSSELIDLMDAITLYPEKRIVGRVDLMTAPQPVLAALPGLIANQDSGSSRSSDEVVDAIVAAREGNGASEEDPESRKHPIWLLVEGIVDLETMRTLLPHVTCRGDVYRAQVWGRSTFASPGTAQRSAMVRFETVLDASKGRCRSVYYRELSAPIDEIKVLTSDEFSTMGFDTSISDKSDF